MAHTRAYLCATWLMLRQEIIVRIPTCMHARTYITRICKCSHTDSDSNTDPLLERSAVLTHKYHTTVSSHSHSSLPSWTLVPNVKCCHLELTTQLLPNPLLPPLTPPPPLPTHALSAGLRVVIISLTPGVSRRMSWSSEGAQIGCGVNMSVIVILSSTADGGVDLGGVCRQQREQREGRCKHS